MIPQAEAQNLTELARQIRVCSLRAIAKAKSGHPGGAFSSAEILAVMYFGIMRHDPANPAWPGRDRFVISKGHCSAGIYATLSLAGYFPPEEFLATFRQVRSPYQGHVDRLTVSGIEVSTGSLGQGQSMANGIAMGLRLDGSPARTYALLSDGELQEGQSWEAIMAAGHYRLGNLTTIIDRNMIQLDGYTEHTMTLDPLPDKFRAFGWDLDEVDGHDISALQGAIRAGWERSPTAKPLAIIAHTVKGKGVSFMEDKVSWHGKPPNEEELAAALRELGDG